MVDAGPAEPAELARRAGALARRAAAHIVVDDVESPALCEADSHHLRAVLRLRTGESVSVTDGRGGWRSCVWVAGEGAIEVAGEVVRVSRAAPAVCVAFAPVKGDRNEWAVQKLTELGVDRIVLLRTDRAVVRWDEGRSASHLGRLRKVARQAVMQSRRLWMPAVDGAVDVESLLVQDGGDGAALADPSGTAGFAGVRTVLVGPEGGWSERELSLSKDRLIRLGDGVLRTETAAVAAGVLLAALRGGVVAPAGEEST
ncbi:MAG TPA: RsmE family RNA methyltransferase [Acidimicrobiales bacterium]|nr:RsmE family RNA methyltransferase [Acidimicrobiales bacterium]